MQLNLPPNTTIEYEGIRSLIRQLPTPYIITGDLNAHNHIWGSHQTNKRGETIEEILNNEDITLLNDGSETHFSARTGNSSAIDLTLVDPKLLPDLEWEVCNYNYNSDHFPIKTTFTSNITYNTPKPLRGRWKTETADWEKFSAEMSTATINFTENINTVIHKFTQNMLQAANNTMRTKTPSPNNTAVCWWNKKCEKAVENHKTALKNIPSAENNSQLNRIKKGSRNNKKNNLRKQKRILEPLQIYNQSRYPIQEDLGKNQRQMDPSINQRTRTQQQNTHQPIRNCKYTS